MTDPQTPPSPDPSGPSGYGQPQYPQGGGYGTPAQEFGQSPYPAPGYGPPQTSGKAIAVMVLGIVGLALMCGYGIGIIPAIVGLAIAPSAKREIERSGGRLTGLGQLKAGIICSWVTVGIVVAAILVIVVLAVVAATTSS